MLSFVEDFVDIGRCLQKLKNQVFAVKMKVLFTNCQGRHGGDCSNENISLGTRSWSPRIRKCGQNCLVVSVAWWSNVSQGFDQSQQEAGHSSADANCFCVWWTTGFRLGPWNLPAKRVPDQDPGMAKRVQISSTLVLRLFLCLVCSRSFCERRAI